MNTEKLLGRIRVLHIKGFRASDRRRQEHVGGSGGMLPREIVKIYVLGNAISNILRGNLINLSNDI